MLVYYQKDWYFVEYKIEKKNKKFVKKYEKRVLKSLDKVLIDLPQERQIYFLLDENKFKFYTFNMFVRVSRPLILSQLNQIIEKKKNLVRNYFSEKKKLLYIYTDNIFINWEKKYFLLGQKGDIFFDLRFIFVDEDIYDDFQRIWNKSLLKLNFIRPKSLYTVKFLSEGLNKRNFLILYFFEKNLVLHQVKDWFYKKISKLNFWISYLKKLFYDKQVENLYYRFRKWDNLGPVWEKIVVDILGFYFDMIFNWIKNELEDMLYDDLIVIGLNEFKKSDLIFRFSKYRKNWINWVLPFNRSDVLDKKFWNTN